MLAKIRTATAWITGRHIAATLPEKEARAFRLTANTQLILAAFTILMWFAPQAPEEMDLVHFVSVRMLVELCIAWILLRKKWLLTSQVITCISLSVQVAMVAFGFTGQHVHYFLPVAMLLPLLLIARTRTLARAILALIPLGLLVFHQVYFKIMGGASFYGPRPQTFLPEQVLPDLIGSQLILLFIAYQFIAAGDRAEAKLEQEHRKSENLLLNILPEEVARELKERGSSEPRQFHATVCFTDFRGFTQIAESLSPRELVSELDRCFSYFDSLMDRHNLEKLKTIGDSYMFAGGIPTPNATHAVDCVLAAIEIQAFMNQMKAIKAEQGLPYWELRLGIHSGDLVAGVIGEKKFAYDVWSDTVNTASRCESSGVPGRINISKETYELVKDFFQCEYRGAVPAKNKGQIEMYFVEGLLPELRRAGDGRVPNEEFARRYAALAREI